MRTAILLHNLHPLAKEWHNDMWGNPSEKKLGRVPKALGLLRQFEAELLIIGGASIEHPETGMNLAEHLARYIERRWDELVLFEEFAGWHLTNLNDRFASARDVSLCANNTREEIAGALAMCAGRGISQLILVSSPSHTPRCLRDADSLRLENPAWRKINVLAASSDAYYEGSSPDQTVIIERPHRGDSPEELYGLHRFAHFMMKRFMGETIEGKRKIVAACESLDLPNI